MVETQNKKMGIGQSKKKRKHEGLMNQSKDLLQREESPPSTPKNLKSILASEALTREFREFLHILDSADASESGERVLSLDFVLAVRGVLSSPEADQQLRIRRLGEKYFRVPGEGIVLDNKQLWERCSTMCRRAQISPDDLKLLKLAETSVRRQLDELHVVFLDSRKENSMLQDIKNCIL